MSDNRTDVESKQQSFWKSVPGILAGIAAIIAALSTLVGGLYSAGIIGSQGPGRVDVVTNGTTSPNTKTQSVLICSGSSTCPMGLGYPRGAPPLGDCHVHIPLDLPAATKAVEGSFRKMGIERLTGGKAEEFTITKLEAHTTLRHLSMCGQSIPASTDRLARLTFHFAYVPE